MYTPNVRRTIALAALLVLGAVVAATSASCSSSGVELSGSCSINSDCDPPLICAFGKCHKACEVSSDCPVTNPAERCIVSGTTGVCELPDELTCSGTKPCPTTLLCASDEQCRTPCEMNNQCAGGQVCLAQAVTAIVGGACFDDTELGDGGIVGPGDGAPGSGGDGSGSSGGGSNDGSPSTGMDGSGTTSPGCANPSAFGRGAVGTSKGSYASGAGTRTASGLILLNDDNAPIMTDAGTIYEVVPQGFDFAGNPVTTGPTLQPISYGAGVGTILAAGTSPDGTTLFVEDGLFSGQYTSTNYFLLKPDLSVVVASSLENTAAFPADLQWAGDRFVMAWLYNGAAGKGVKVQMLGTDGSVFGAGTLATDAPDSTVFGNLVTVAVSGNTVAVGYESSVNHYPVVQLLDLNATAIGGPVSVAPVVPTAYALGGTATGFVAVYDGAGDAGDVAQSVNVTLAGTASPTVGAPAVIAGGKVDVARGTSDGTGAGFALLYDDGLSFGYSTGSTLHVTPVTTAGNDDPVNISAFGGHFGLFRYAVQEQRTYGFASGCPATAAAGH